MKPSVPVAASVLISSLTAALAAPNQPAAPVTQNFEESSVASGWIGDGGSATPVLDTGRYKSGRQSLLWQWTGENATLTYRNAGAFAGIRADSALGLWVHNENPVAAPMRVELLSGDNVVGSAWFWMDYQGWRPLVAPYARTGLTPGRVVDGIRFHAPRGVASGRLHLDGARFDFPLNPQFKAAYTTYQMPWWKKDTTATTPPAGVILSDADIGLNRPWLTAGPPGAVTAEERADLEKLSRRLLPPLVRPGNGLRPGTLEHLRQRMAEYAIRRTGEVVTGRAIENGPAGPGSRADTGVALPTEGAVDFFEYLKFCREVQQAYAAARESAELLELKSMFTDLSAHLLDQGWAEGVMIRKFTNYPGPGLESFLLMRDVLKEAGLARGIALGLAYHLACQTPGNYLDEHPVASMDGLGFWNNELLRCVLMLPDESERLSRVRAVQRFYSLALTNPATLGPDGCTYHHGAFHFAYASYNIPRLMTALDAMSDTVFRLAPEAHGRLRTYVRAIAFTMSDGEQAYNLGARAGTPLRGNMAALAASLAKMGTPDGREKLDTKMAALYLTQIKESEKDREPAKSWIAAGIRPLPLTGHLTMNGSPLAVHRRDDQIVSLAGMSPFWRGLEIYGWTRTNNYARYARNGSICVTSNGSPPSLAESGWNKEGWDWCHFPGATNPVRPSREIFDGYAMYGNSNAFSGGTDLGDDGVWGMDFNGADGVQFKRSAFCFGNRVTVVTTDIRGKTDAPMVTTLFQNSLKSGSETVIADGAPVDGFPAERRIEGDRAHWLLDNKGTGYLLPAGHDPVILTCRRQEWTYMLPEYLIDPAVNELKEPADYMRFTTKGKDMAAYEKRYRPTAGDFATAWFAHGKKPADAACAYTLVVKTNPEQMKALAADLPCRILRSDASVHAVSDRATHTTGHVLFSANRNVGVEGFLLANDQPCLVMIREAGEGRLQLSLARTDIKRTGPVRLTLRGAWKTSGEAGSGNAATTSPAGDDTVIAITPDHYMARVVELKPNRRS